MHVLRVVVRQHASGAGAENHRRTGPFRELPDLSRMAPRSAAGLDRDPAGIGDESRGACKLLAAGGS